MKRHAARWLRHCPRCAAGYRSDADLLHHVDYCTGRPHRRGDDDHEPPHRRQKEEEGMMMTNRMMLVAVATLATMGASGAWAQTPTPWLPIATPVPRAAIVPLTATLLDGATEAGASGGVAVDRYRDATIQVTVADTCISYTLAVEASNDGTHWATLTTKDEGDFAAGTSGTVTLGLDPVFARVRLAAVDTCTVSAILHATP